MVRGTRRKMSRRKRTFFYIRTPTRFVEVLSSKRTRFVKESDVPASIRQKAIRNPRKRFTV